MRLTSVFRRHFVMLVGGLPLVANTRQRNGRESAAPRWQVPPRLGLALHFALLLTHTDCLQAQFTKTTRNQYAHEEASIRT